MTTYARRKLDLAPLNTLWNSPDWYTREGWERFLKMYEEDLGGEKLALVDVQDALTYVSHFSWESMMKREYRAAECAMRRFLSHSDVDECYVRFLHDFRVRLGLCALVDRREAEALDAFRREMALASNEERIVVACMIRNGLGADRRVWALTTVLQRRGVASAELTGFVVELARVIRERPARLERRRRSSYAKLARILWKTLGKPRNPRGYRSPEDVLKEAREGVEEAIREIRAEQARKKGAA